MKILKTIGLILLALIVLILVVALIAPKSVTSKQEVSIDAPVELVFNAVNDLSQWENWSIWKASDSTMVTTLGDNYIGEGGSYSWSGDVVGEGELKILSSTANEAIKTDIKFGPMGGANGHWTFAPAEGGTNVNWDVTSKFGYPFNLMLLFGDWEGMMSEEFNKGLKMLKDHAESISSTMSNTMEIKEMNLPTRYYIGIRETVKMEDMAKHYAENLPKVFTAVTKNGLELAGMPSGLYYTWDMENSTTELFQGAPLKEKATIDGFETIELPASKALVLNYYGPYDGLGSAHEALDAYAKEKGLTSLPPAIEEYVTDPGQEPDTSKWLTQVVYYVK
ncbi:MAG: hypothetical protein DWQ02_07975 [Bacteroidetes bacterium]|nr:MAG: hypothetical protein DWQ02_07975 [Bacteroidota bacterium]